MLAVAKNREVTDEGGNIFQRLPTPWQWSTMRARPGEGLAAHGITPGFIQ